MAKKRKQKKEKNTKSFGSTVGFTNIFGNEKLNFVSGIVLILVAVFLVFAFVSYFSTGAADQSMVLDLRPGELENKTQSFQNYCGSIGAVLSHLLIKRCFGLPVFLVPVFITVSGLRLMQAYRPNLWKWFFSLTLVMVWCSVAFAKFLTPLMGEQVFNPGGDHGVFCATWLENIIGTPGLVAILALVAIAFLTYLSSETIIWLRKLLNPLGYIDKVKFTISNLKEKEEKPDTKHNTDKPDKLEEDPKVFDDPDIQQVAFTPDGGIVISDSVSNKRNASAEKAPKSQQTHNEPDMEIVVAKEEEKIKGGQVNPTNPLDTPINPKEPFVNYRYPTLSLLKQYENDGKPYIDEEEQMANKKRIVEVLNSFGVQISSILATVGPTITLYEITPAPGVKIARIRNLEDDIALSLAALGIRIIAPMPGKGTIGIEVPNAKANVVSMLSILNSRKFQETTMELPLALGKTITNEVFMVDLAKIPHLLVAGATGQGKSVGMNAIITSLLYKKHPNELKFVLVDPKKVEFSVYAPIANHFMAANEDNMEDPIITDVTRVVKTLKGLCVLMDTRYDLLKKASARNIKEYNAKFLNHKLSPEDGHEYMPYIVVIIDEFADLIMTAGKEIELPITRIAQLARAVGMHMVIATQRPSTKVITGGIKANFPGRIAFKVSSRIDSSIILDRTGAHQLIGRGDMLYANGTEPVRVQCAFVDTPEVETINEFISRQLGPVEPMVIPEPISDDGEAGTGPKSFDSTKLDPLFAETARNIVLTQQGSTSMIQRKFEIGYNRAGRLMDQMEKAGIVGAARGSKPREVLIADENQLNLLLQQIGA